MQKLGGRKIRHSIKECPYCYEEARNSGKFANASLPLSVQKNALSSSMLNRVMVYVGENKEQRTYLERALDIHVNRTLSEDEGIRPNSRNIRSELSHVFSNAQVNDRVIVYLENDVDFMVDTVLDAVNPESRVWIVTPHEFEDQGYTWTFEGGRVVKSVNGDRVKNYMCIYALSGDTDLLETFKRRKGRVTVDSLVKSGMTFRSSYDADLTRMYFSFS